MFDLDQAGLRIERREETVNFVNAFRFCAGGDSFAVSHLQ
jgi:hypothetical protein